MRQRTIGFSTVARGLCLAVLLFTAVQALGGCNYARMRDDEAGQAYNQQYPVMPKQAVPVGGSIWIEKHSAPSDLVNAAPDTPQSVELGAERYNFYCVQCHGKRADGNGTVGQSFAPLPANLRSAQVRDQVDGELYYKIRYGFNRHPPLFSTVSSKEAWALVRYIRALPKQM